jgi:Z1 domain
MPTPIELIKKIKPKLLWEPERKDFTEQFLKNKSNDPNGPSYEDLTEGPDSVLIEAIRILGRCQPPAGPVGSKTGLVVGYVQSGKTMSFETVIALARDNGFGLVILLAGTKNNLLDQSVSRIKEDLGIDDGGDHWHHVANPGKADKTLIEQKLSAWRKKSTKKSVLVTVLKHGGHIENLTDLLGGLGLTEVPTLIIDDESDQASLNTQAAKIRKGTVAADEMSTTYEKILDLRDVLPHHSYLQYTATPQANLLLAQTDLLNASFAELVTPGDAYTGGRAFFKGSSALIQEIPVNEVSTPLLPVKTIPKSLVKSLRFFLLATSQHSLTRVNALKAKDRNRSMMVHPSAETKSHKVYKAWIDRAFKTLKSYVEKNYKTNSTLVTDYFKEEYISLQKTYPSIKPLNALIAEMVDEVFDELDIVEVNGTADARKKIHWKGMRYWILVGGAKLDRGYTVEGLCVTYMPRGLGTSPAADTLQQRARFFGYKKAYLGMCRVFLQDTVKGAFTEYVEHEEFVRTALEATRGKPLTDWRRDFILTEMLKPTRPNVVGLGTRRVPVDGWLIPSVMQRDEDAAEINRALLKKIVPKWKTKFNGVVDASIAVKGAPAAGSPHDVIQNVLLADVLGDFLLELKVKDPRDAEEHSALLVWLSQLLAKNSDLQVDVFLMNRLTTGYRTRTEGRGVKADHKFAPINQYSSNSAGSLNDRDYFSETRLTLQLRSFDLGTFIRDPARADIKNVTWFAVHVPELFRKSLIVQERT